MGGGVGGLGGSSLPRTDTYISTSSYRSDVSGTFPLPRPPTTEAGDDDDEREEERAAHSSSSTPFLLTQQADLAASTPLPDTSSIATRQSSALSHVPSNRSASTTTAEHGHPSSLRPGQAPSFTPSTAPPRPHTPPYPYAPPSAPSFASTTLAPSSAIPIPLIHSRARIRDILAGVIAATTYSGSVVCATCGPGPLVEEVGNACADAIRPRKVWEGEHRVNVVSVSVHVRAP